MDYSNNMEETIKRRIYFERKFIYDKLVVLFLIWTVLQEIVLGLTYQAISSVSFVKALLYAKDVAMVLLFAYAVIFRIKNKRSKYFKLMVFYFVWILFEFFYGVVVGKSEIGNAAASVRGFLLLPCFIVIGYSIKNKNYFSKKVVWFIESFLVFIAFVGIMEFALDYLVGTKEFWVNTIGIGKYLNEIKGQSIDRFYEGLPGNFYGYNNGVFFAQKRLVSLWAGPLTAGYVLLIPFLYFLIKVLNCKKSYLKFIVCTLAVVLTYTRAIILFAGIAAFILIVFYKKYYKSLYLIIPLGIVFVVWKFNSIMSYLYDGSTMGHISAIKDSIKQVSLFGSGFGTFGSYGNIGTESTYLSCMGQMGIIGLVMYLVLNWWLLKRLRQIYKSTKNNFALALYIAQIVYLFTGLISEQLIASTTISPFYIIAGSFIARYPVVKKAVVVKKESAQIGAKQVEAVC